MEAITGHPIRALALVFCMLLAVMTASHAVAPMVTGGEYHTAGLKSDGSVWTSGANDSGQLGDGTTAQRLVPVQVMAGAIEVETGYYHTVALKADGTVERVKRVKGPRKARKGSAI